MKGDYKLGGFLGISLLDPEEFHKVDLNTETVRVHGHITPRPSVGQTLIGEFQKSFILFEFVHVDYCLDPNDQFFADVKVIGQEMKENKNVD